MSYLRPETIALDDPSQFHSNIFCSNRLQHSRRRSGGIIFAILVHIGLVIAIGSGLRITDTFREPPSIILRAIDPPPVTPPTKAPVDTGVAEKTFTVAKPQLPTVDTAPIDSDDGHRPLPVSPSISDNGSGTQIIEAKIDPRHPLTQPDYPQISRRLSEQGTVELSLYILADGRIGEVRVERSSGFARLDEAARQHALKSWRLLPQMIDGVANATWQRITITFRLKNN